MSGVGERLILVRHAAPATDPRVPAAAWGLSPAGRAAARALAAAAPASAYFVASDEPKALQTLRGMSSGRDVAADRGFREVRRPDRWSDEYRSLARAYLDGTRHAGWEPHTRVAARFEAAVNRHARIAAAARGTLIVGTHGLAATVWLASQLRLDPSPADFWAQLRFPDVIDVDLRARWARRRGQIPEAGPGAGRTARAG